MSTLSRILGQTPRFSFFNELIAVSSVSASSNYDLFKISKTVDGIIEYLEEVLHSFEQARRLDQSSQNDLDWIFEGKDGLMDIIKNLESIDGIISQLLNVVDASPQIPRTLQLLHKFERTSDLLLDVKKHSIVYKKKLDVSIHFKDLDGVIKSLVLEMNSCSNMLLQLRSDGKKNHKNGIDNGDTLETIVEQMKSSGGGQLKLPTDEVLYSQWLELQSRVKPLEVSLQFLPVRIEEMQTICKSLTNKSIIDFPKRKLDDNYANLVNKSNSLRKQLEDVRQEIFASKWHDLFEFLIRKTSEMCMELLLQVKQQDKSEDIGSNYRLCSNAITIINKAFAEEKITGDTSLIIEFNDNLIPKWQTLNEEMSNQSNHEPVGGSKLKSLPVGVRNSAILKPYHIVRKSPTPEAEINPTAENGFGIDFGVGVKAIDPTKVPYSIQQKDKVRDIFAHRKSQPKGKELMMKLAKTEDEEEIVHNRSMTDLDFDEEEDEDDDDDDTSTLVTTSKTRFTSFEDKDISRGLSRLSVDETLGKQVSWDFLRNHKSDSPSRIPLIVVDFHLKGFPRIHKLISPWSRIPTISPNHPVFHSATPKIRLKLKPPAMIVRDKVFQSPSPRNGNSDDNDDDVFRKPTRRPSTIDSSKHILRPARSMSSLTKTPELKYESPTWRSTSPERPTSSIGSRYDDKHLLQPLTSPKPGWR
ncbi:hypothetical protein CAAN1_23S01860 [[Candida] anglica]|uniref:Karyogamy protein n=1 Tax=[Candida] anglica TaxID=148631 RepID=A0ABP0EBH0_9ASCO